MLNPNYLSVSRHHVFYFRFPIPAHLHPQGKRTDIKLSLDTRCPREALQIARVLGYVGNQFLNQPETRHMKYQQIRDTLTQFFQMAYERHKERIAKYGRLSELDKSALDSGLTVQALKDKDYLIMGRDEDITRLISHLMLPIKPHTAEFEVLRTEYLR